MLCAAPQHSVPWKWVLWTVCCKTQSLDTVPHFDGTWTGTRINRHFEVVLGVLYRFLFIIYSLGLCYFAVLSLCLFHSFWPFLPISLAMSLLQAVWQRVSAAVSSCKSFDVCLIAAVLRNHNLRAMWEVESVGSVVRD